MDAVKGILALGIWFGSMYLLRDLGASSEMGNVVIYYLVPAFVLYWTMRLLERDREEKGAGAIIVVVLYVLMGIATILNHDTNQFIACALTVLIFYVISMHTAQKFTK